MITRADKEQGIKAINEKFAKSKGTFIIDFKGMKVEQVTTLRKKLHAAESEMKVVRNTLARRALKDYPAAEKALSGSLRGTNALIFSYGEVTSTAKALATFAKDVEIMQIKTGVMGDEALNDAKIKMLATLPGKNEVRAMFLGVLNAPGSKLARCLNEYAKKLGGGAEAAPQA
jgi:large subunit ribosomal protein L10